MSPELVDRVDGPGWPWLPGRDKAVERGLVDLLVSETVGEGAMPEEGHPDAHR